jgi:hypothetical protein
MQKNASLWIGYQRPQPASALPHSAAWAGCWIRLLAWTQSTCCLLRAWQTGSAPPQPWKGFSAAAPVGQSPRMQVQKSFEATGPMVSPMASPLTKVVMPGCHPDDAAAADHQLSSGLSYLSLRRRMTSRIHPVSATVCSHSVAASI